MHPGFWWQNELEMWLGRLMGRIWNILCLFAMLKKTVMAGVFTFSRWRSWSFPFWDIVCHHLLVAKIVG
jgi:hypothetical protein